MKKLTVIILGLIILLPMVLLQSCREGNIFSRDPLLEKSSFMPDKNSPGINAGRKKYSANGKVLVDIPNDYYAGTAPDIGAMEFGMKNH